MVNISFIHINILNKYVLMTEMLPYGAAECNPFFYRKFNFVESYNLYGTATARFC